MSRRKKQHGHANHERWLVSYADFITLLFAFFVVLYASAVVDNKKIAQVSAAIQGGFQQLGAFSGSTSLPNQAGAANQAPMILPEPAPPPLPEHDADGGAGSGSFGPPDVDKLKHELEQALGEEIQKHEIEMRVTPEGLVVSLREVGFFNSGDATLLTGGQNTLTRIAKVLNSQGFHIRVEGHTDDRPIHNGRFKSNWELSTARATEVVSLLIEKHGFDPSQISAAGYSQYRPITSNDTDEGRQTNRRVDVVVVARTARPDVKPSPSVAQAPPAPPIGQ
ncbi:MAG TPA: flagellar motor protein MotB [Terriglobales bacterium]|nr:flagellar motor protein MotB [Terriglobales bacterium]